MTITAEAFIVAWQTSNSYKEVEEKTGMSYNTINVRGHAYRKKGIPLKRFAKTGAENIEALRKLAEDTLKQSEAEEAKL